MQHLNIQALAERAAAAAEGAPRLSIRRFRLELAILLLLLSTFAAIAFQDLFTSRSLSLRPDNVSRFVPFWYDDKGNGGNSTIAVDPQRPLRWSCELRPAYQYPFCGYGILLDPLQLGRGVDLSDFQRATITFRYSGPGPYLRMAIKNVDPNNSKRVIPSEIIFPVKQGPQTITLNLSEAGIPIWWAVQNHVRDTVRQPPRDNVTGVELQPGKGALPGHYEFVVDSIVLEGRHLSPAQFYLALLSFWTALVVLFLLWRVVRIRKDYEQRHAEQLEESRAMERAKMAAESASAAKSAFLANMSHELRTPLNAILGYAQMLEGEPLSERQAAAARTIHQSGAHLLTLITDILDLSKIEAGRLELTPAPFDLHACFDRVAEMMQLRAAEKKLEFACSVTPDVPRFVIGDERRLRQVLINLLGNAIKFTAEGKVGLRLSASGQGDEKRVRIEVRDTGPGIAETELARVFEPFEQLGDPDRQSVGTGLGLSISREIVALMGGRIEVESEEGFGSLFWLDLPLPVADEADVVRAAPSPGRLRAAAPAPDMPEADAVVPPPPDQLHVLLNLAMAGNMRAIRAFADDLAAAGAEYEPFAQRLRVLAAAYQSPAILDLVSRYTQEIA